MRTRSAQEAPVVVPNRDARTAVPAPPARIGLVRGFPRLYEMQADTGYAVATPPPARWNRGILYRAATPVLNLGRNYPQWDKTMLTPQPGNR